jgi:hypothetical protein
VYRKFYRVPIQTLYKKRKITKALHRLFYTNPIMVKKILLKAKSFKKLFTSLKRRYYIGMRAFTRRLPNPERKALYLDAENFIPLWYGIPSRSFFGDVLVDATWFIYRKNIRVAPRR